MITVLNAIYAVILVCVLVYTISYCRYEFKNKNTLGAVAILVLCAAVVLTPAAVFIVSMVRH